MDAQALHEVFRLLNNGVVLHFLAQSIVVSVPAQTANIIVSLLTGIAGNCHTREVVVNEVLTCRLPRIDFIAGAVAHLHDIVVRVHIVGNFRRTSPAEVWVELMLVSPLVAKTPDGVVIAVDQRVAVEHTAFLVNVEGYAKAALEHVVSIVDISEGAVLRNEVVLREAEHVVFPNDQRVEHVHVLLIAEAASG